MVNQPDNQPVSKPVERREPAPPRDLGKGGAQHQAIQQRIKQTAEQLGFRSLIEKPLSGRESVDLFLERGDQSIACEISFSTTIDHEVGNVAKCLKAGLPKIVILCVEAERLRKIEEAVTASLGPEAAARVSYYLPDDFISTLKALPQPVVKPADMKVRGYKVTRSVPTLTTEERKQKEDIAHRSISETMRSPGKGRKP